MFVFMILLYAIICRNMTWFVNTCFIITCEERNSKQIIFLILLFKGLNIAFTYRVS
jgi:hypothetical protein